MFNIRKVIREFFGFTQSQTQGFLVLVPLMLLFIFSKPLLSWILLDNQIDFSKDRAQLDSLVAHWEVKPVDEVPIDQAPQFFLFNPNTASMEDLRTLGFSSGVASRIIKYRSNKGVFRSKSDILKIYGVDSAHVEKLKAFIDLPANLLEKNRFQVVKERVTKEPVSPKTLSDANTADTLQWRKVKGIGEKLAIRIIRYRSALGGFVHIDQLNEVYGLDSAVIHQVLDGFYVSNDFSPAKINVNTADEMALSAHPYLSKKMAVAITTYRFQHGKFSSVEDLRKIPALPANIIEKITPYLTVHD